MRHDKLEILAPAGNKESFISAINAGANAFKKCACFCDD